MTFTRILGVAFTCLLIIACGKDSEQPSQAFKAETPGNVQPASAPEVKLNDAQPVAASPVIPQPPAPAVPPKPIMPQGDDSSSSTHSEDAADASVHLEAVREELGRQLDAHKALIERLQRKEIELGQRVNVLEYQLSNGTPARKARIHKPNRGSSDPQPVETSQRRSAGAALPLPFAVESVDTWNGEKRVVVRSGGQLLDLRPGETHAGWRIESTDGQTVTVSGPKGHVQQIEARDR